MVFLVEAQFGAERECIWLEDEDSTLACVRDLLRANATVQVSLIAANPANDPGQDEALTAPSP